MPFVKTIRKYYKETVTSELKMACYYCPELRKGSGGYIYAKAPLGSILEAYRSSTRYEVVAALNRVSIDVDNIFGSVNEDSVEILYWSDKSLIGVGTRHPEGDIYEEVVSEVEVSSDDDWTRYETLGDKYYQLAKPKRTYYKYSNEVDVNVVGNRSFVKEGIASDFKAASYLLLPDTFDIAGGKTWEIVTCFETGSDITTEGNLVGTNYYRYDPVSLSITSSHFVLEVCSGTGTTVFEAVGTYTVQPNTKYWLRASFNGSEYIVEYSLDGVDYVVDITKASAKSAYSQPLIIGGQAATDNGTVKFPWLGSIYLKECYMKIDGEFWWNGATDVYTAVGKWIDEGVASGFSSSQYITVPRPFVEASKSWEAVVKIKTGALSNNNLFIGGKSKFKSGICVYITTSGNLNVSLSGNGSSWSIAEATTIATGFTANTDYWFKAEFTGDKYKFSYSADGVEWSEPYIINSSVPIYSSDYWMLGAGYAGGTTFYTLNSAIYLNDCYIKLGDRLWWHGTKVIDGDKDNYSFYEDRLLSYEIKHPDVYYTFSINPTPADAIVTINGENVNSVTLIKGSKVTWSVEADGYAKQSSEVILDKNIDLSVVLEEQHYDPSLVDVPVTFNYTGSVQSYTVPEGFTKLRVDCVGAAGGTYNSMLGGAGGRVECVLSVKPHDLLYLYVGGKGAVAAGWNGGGLCNTKKTSYKDSGGGASDIRTVEASSGSWYDTAHSSWDTDVSLLSRLVVAGGGGGMSQNKEGGAGGGLEGGVLNGGSGTPCTPATQTSGGTGANDGGDRGGNGVFGQGGAGNVSSYWSGAGGGGGWYGGGGGIYFQSGGGGSSYTHPDKCIEVIHTQGYSSATGNGWIILTPIG